ncbi:MAG: hypothetical protein QXI33_03420 [Candidatus Pacearchaeota archaeon]
MAVKKEKIKKENVRKSLEERETEEEKLEKIIKEKEEKENKEIDKNYEKIYQKQGTWILIILGVIIASVFLSFWISIETKKFDYIGQTFQKEYFGQIPIYTTQFNGYSPITGQAVNTKINLRNDPRESKVPVIGKIKYLKNKPAYISLNMSSKIYECGSIALVSLGQFMNGVGIPIITGISDEEGAIEYGKPYITCENTNQSTVFVLTKGEKSEIRQLNENPNCYILSVNNCEIVEVIERLEVASLASFNNRQI